MGKQVLSCVVGAGMDCATIEAYPHVSEWLVVCSRHDAGDLSHSTGNHCESGLGEESGDVSCRWSCGVTVIVVIITVEAAASFCPLAFEGVVIVARCQTVFVDRYHQVVTICIGKGLIQGDVDDVGSGW